MPIAKGDKMTDKEKHQKIRSAIHSLPIVTIKGKRYYQDNRLQEFRAVGNPHDRIEFAEFTFTRQ